MKTVQRDLSDYDTVFGHARSRYTCADTVRLRRTPTGTKYKPEVETVPQTGNTNNLATETDIDAISVAIPMFWGKVFSHWCICRLCPTFPSPEIRVDICFCC